MYVYGKTGHFCVCEKKKSNIFLSVMVILKTSSWTDLGSLLIPIFLFQHYMSKISVQNILHVFYTENIAISV